MKTNRANSEITSEKVYVNVVVSFYEDGRMNPTKIIWEDGRKFQIDKIIDRRPAAAQKVGGQGDRYTIMINNRSHYLFFERSTKFTGNIGRWFVEKNGV